MQTIEINVFDRSGLESLLGALSPAALCFTDPYPVGGEITCASETLPIDETFEQVDGVSVLGHPVGGNPAGNRSEDMTG
jgi:hypothetical protein